MPSEPSCSTCAATLQRAIHAETLLATYKKIVWQYVNDEPAPPTTAEEARAAA